MTNGRANGVIGFLNLAPDGGIRHFTDGGMTPTMIADLVPFAGGALQDLGRALRILPEDEKRRGQVGPAAGGGANAGDGAERRTGAAGRHTCR